MGAGTKEVATIEALPDKVNFLKQTEMKKIANSNKLASFEATLVQNLPKIKTRKCLFLDLYTDILY